LMKRGGPTLRKKYSSLVEDALIKAFRNLGVDVKGTISSREAEQDRPISRGPPSGELIKEMRRKK